MDEEKLNETNKKKKNVFLTNKLLFLLKKPNNIIMKNTIENVVEWVME